ncbi:MAG: methylmalonyl Co-A mutase-associated GTPase MeaB [Candidatus Obscuribacterales bacterium]|nr:methylmalonyl Co-A mutase-associated GTPase MeaB [Candidatus Obscuribacterales bacterium]
MSIKTLEFSLEKIAADLVNGDRRSLARALSIVEDGGDEAAWLVRRLFPYAGRAHLIGITGPPGVGKSTLVDALISQIRSDGLKVGVLAIDPSSPFSGGAILGDRIRMQGHTLDKNVFIRSMANRGHSGGTALATYDAVRMMEAAGNQVVIIETVGVGQSELAIAETADTTVLVLMPGSGDDVQAIKSGIMEIGDVFVVNKGDLPGANKTASEILASLELSNRGQAWKQPVQVTNAETNQNVNAVWLSIQEHKKYLDESNQLTERRKRRVESELTELVADIARKNLKDSLEHSSGVQSVLQKMLRQEMDPHCAAEAVMEDLFGKSRQPAVE